MTVDEHLEAAASNMDSMFQAALAREDIGRLAKLRELAKTSPDFESFARDALFVGWTAGDLRSKDLAPALEPFAAALWAEAHDAENAPDLMEAWTVFSGERMRILIHCL